MSPLTFKVIMTCWIVSEAMYCLATIGGERKPITPGGALFAAVLAGLMVAGIWRILA